MTGSWNIDVNTNGMPQKVASAFGKISEELIGAEYEFIAYIGTQVVNGVNHGVLATQTVLTGKDSKNIVLLIFNEKPREMELTLVGIERILESGGEFGGTTIEPSTADFDVTTWEKGVEDLIGVRLEPFAYIGNKVTTGTEKIYVATATPVAPNAKSKVVLVSINPVLKRTAISDLLENKVEKALGYSFTW